MRKLFMVTAVMEVAVGLGMLVLPSLVTAKLLGASVTTPLESVMTRLCGVIVLAVGVICWLVRDDERSHVARGVAGGLVLYDAGAVAILLYAGLGLGMSGALLWPAALLHLGRGAAGPQVHASAGHAASRLTTRA